MFKACKGRIPLIHDSVIPDQCRSQLKLYYDLFEIRTVLIKDKEHSINISWKQFDCLIILLDDPALSN